MALHVSIDKAQRLITTRGSGEISDADLDALQRSFKSDPDFSPEFSRICDLSEATGVVISDELLNKWAEDPIIERSARHAIVCSHPTIMNRVLEFVRQSRIHSRDVSVFPTFRQASSWVNQSSDRSKW